MHSLGQVNAKDRLGWSLLMLAVVNGHVDCTKLLLKLNADVEAEASSPNGAPLPCRSMGAFPFLRPNALN